MGLSRSEISALYVSLFGRVSEGGGNDYWANVSKVYNYSIANVADAMLETSDSKKYFGSNLKDNFKFINFIYENTLNKSVYASKGMEVDIEGVNYWASLLNKGYSKGDVVASMINAIYDPKYSNLDAAKLFKNKVLLSDAVSRLVDKADINNLTPFVDIIARVKPSSTSYEINSMSMDLKKLLDNPGTELGYRWDGDNLILKKDAVGMITIDKIPRSISIEGRDIRAETEKYHSYATERDFLKYITMTEQTSKKKVDASKSVVAYNYDVNNTRYVVVEKDGVRSTYKEFLWFGDDEKEIYSPNGDVMLRIIDVPKSMPNYSGSGSKISLNNSVNIPPKPYFSTNPHTVDKTQQTDGYHWESDILVLDRDVKGIIKINKIPNAIKIPIDGVGKISTIEGSVKSYHSYDDMINNISEKSYATQNFKNKGLVGQAQVNDTRYVYINKDGYDSGDGRIFDASSDVMIAIAGLSDTKKEYVGYNNDEINITL